MPWAPLRLTTRIQAADATTTLLDFLARRFRYHDRATWDTKIRTCQILVDGRPSQAWTRLQRGMVVTYETLHREPEVETEIPVLRETSNLLFVAKPAGLPVHADGTFVRHTLVHLLREQFGAHLQPAHRLDRETSGVLVLSKDRGTARAVQSQFQRGEVAKAYQAIVRGIVGADALTIDAPLGRDPGSRVSIRRAPVPASAADAQTALTEVRVLRRLHDSTLVEAVPRTGRTHQIRAHLASVGHSLVGDVLYGRDDDSYLAWVAHVKGGGESAWPQGRDAPRHFLHARTLKLTTADGEPLAVSAPLPADMQGWLQRPC
ncbi:MAG: RluA family pseudouridine synthase [Planctomycetota bacterium]